MNKKLLILLFTFATMLNAQTTVCHKNNWDNPSTIEKTPLDGGECDGKYSIDDMKKANWNVADIKIDSSKEGLTYRYFLVKESLIQKDDIDITSIDSRKKFSINPVGIKLEEVNNNKSKINIGNLLVGQSGIVVHIYDENKKQIIANAKVISSNENSSLVEFFTFDDLRQPALPISNRKVEQGDILILNYMYPTSFLIAPTQETFQAVRNGFKYNNFLHSDLFAAKLKAANKPYPTKKDIQNFAINQNVGTIFIVVEQKVYILDTKTFKILTNYDIEYEEKTFELPFYTRVEDIKKSIFEFKLNDVLQGEIGYTEYYKKLLGLD